MGNLQRLPVLVWDEAGLNQEAVDQSEYNRKYSNSGSQYTCGVKNKNHTSIITPVLSLQHSLNISTVHH